MYDMLYQVYCAKLTAEGSDIQQERALRDFIKESKLKRVKESKSFASKEKESESWYKDDARLVKAILGGFALICSLLYYIVLYFTVLEKNDDEQDQYNERQAINRRKRRD